jgi:hypothetical protein
MKRAERTVRQLAAEYGWQLTPTSGGHIKFTKRGCPPVFAAATPSCWRAMRNLEAMLRRVVRQAATQSD